MWQGMDGVHKEMNSDSNYSVSLEADPAPIEP